MQIWSVAVLSPTIFCCKALLCSFLTVSNSTWTTPRAAKQSKLPRGYLLQPPNDAAWSKLFLLKLVNTLPTLSNSIWAVCRSARLGRFATVAYASTSMMPPGVAVLITPYKHPLSMTNRVWALFRFVRPGSFATVAHASTPTQSPHRHRPRRPPRRRRHRPPP